jgi:hypothetical protein
MVGLALVVVTVTTACGGNTGAAKPLDRTTAAASAAGKSAAEPVGFEMRGVHLRAAPNIVLQVSHLSGRLVSRSARPPLFDDQRSFYIDVDSAEVSMDAASIAASVNRVFEYKGSPLSDLRVAIKDGRLEQKGKLHKGIAIPFSVEANVDEWRGQIRLHPESVRVAGIPAAKVMSLFGLELDDLIEVHTGRGVTIHENDLLLEPSHMLPAPEVRGRVARARVAGNRLSLMLGDTRSVAGSHRGDLEGGNYIWFRGGRIQFGRLTMSDADLQLIDADPTDPFDFYSERYNDQLVAGYSRNTKEGALRTVLPDYGDIAKLSGKRLPPPAVGKRVS